MRSSIVKARKIQDQKTITREMFVQQAHANTRASDGPLSDETICSTESKWEYTLESSAEDGFCKTTDIASPPVTRVDAANLIRALQKLEVLAKRQAPRIACKTNGRISFLNLTEVVAVQAEGNYVLLQHPHNSYLLRECLYSIAEKLKPYGFIRIHRSVVVNISAVEEIQPLPTGEYKLRIKGGKSYLVTRLYKDHLKDLAQLWLGSERFPG